MTDYEVQIKRDNCAVETPNGRIVKNSGDWVKVSDVEALRLVTTRQGILPKGKFPFDSSNVEVKILNWHPKHSKLKMPFDGMTIGSGDGNIGVLYNLVLMTKETIALTQNQGMFVKFFGHLHHYDVILILGSYSVSIRGTGVEVEANEAVLPTLDMPYANPNAFGVQNTKAGQAFYTAWREERAKGDFHALSRALIKTTPKVMALPPEWGQYVE